MRLIASILTLTLVAAPVLGGDIEAEFLPTELPPPASPDGDGDIILSLEQAYAMALARNLELAVGRYDLAVADERILENLGIFDPTLEATAETTAQESPTASELEGSKEDTDQLTARLRKLLPTGTGVSLSFFGRRFETNNPFQVINPSWFTSLTLGFDQPLLRDFGTRVNRTGVIVAAMSRTQASAGFEIDVHTTLETVENAYWNLIATRETVTVRERSLELAQRLLGETEERVRVGTSAPIDIVQSEAGVATRQQELIAARNAADEAEDTLKQVLGFTDPAEWNATIVTTDDLDVDRLLPTLDESLDVAWDKRPELQQQLIGNRILEHNLKVSRNQTKPDLSLQADLSYGGLGGDILQEDGSVVSGGVGDAFEQVYDRDFPTWSVGVTFSYPLSNNAAKARLAQDRWEKMQGEQRLQLIRQGITREVRQAVRGLEDGAANLDAAEASLRLARRNLEAEQTKFANGLSTNFQVLQIQEDLSEAALTQVNAKVQYRRALVAYYRATGTILEERSVMLDDPGVDDDVPHDWFTDIKWLQGWNWGDDG